VRALIVEDDADLAKVVTLYLEREDLDVEHVSDGARAWSRFRAVPPDIVLLDLNLPHIDGIELCRRMRDSAARLPIIMITARDAEIDELLGLEVGADDYLTKPFSPRVLVARVRSMLRRASAHAEVPTRLDAGRVVVDVERREARVDGELVPALRAKEFDLLCVLARRPGRVVGRAELQLELYGYDALIGSRAIDQHVANLRKKLPAGDLVHTERGIGYGLRA
jgi:DNA-binding response OmpR family regulator